jgi:hypothetical protein
MKLYHSSNTKICEVDLSKCRPYKDFGQGFYLTDICEQAEQMAKRVARLYGGTPCVSTFSFDELAFSENKLKILSFDKPTREWALFVINNRNRKFLDTDSLLCNHDNKYDIVSGPVANDDIALLFRNFSRGLVDFDALVRGLEYKQLTTQFSFHSKQALALLNTAEE